MSAPTVYRTTHAEPLAAWEDAQRRYGEYHEQVGALKIECGGRDVLQYRAGSTVRFLGLCGEEAPSPLWRYDKREGCWVADRRTKAGKALGKRLNALRVQGLGVLPGMPDAVFEGMAFCTPGVMLLDGVLWVEWSDKTTPDQIERGATFDASMWERGKASEFYAAQELAALSAATPKENEVHQ